MAAVTKITRSQGVTAVTLPYAATSTPKLQSQSALDLHVCYAQLTGNMTINADVSKLQQFQRIVLYFSADGSTRTVTFGTGFISASTLAVSANKDAIAAGYFNGTNIIIDSQAIGS